MLPLVMSVYGSLKSDTQALIEAMATSHVNLQDDYAHWPCEHCTRRSRTVTYSSPLPPLHYSPLSLSLSAHPATSLPARDVVHGGSRPTPQGPRWRKLDPCRRPSDELRTTKSAVSSVSREMHEEEPNIVSMENADSEDEAYASLIVTVLSAPLQVDIFD